MIKNGEIKPGYCQIIKYVPIFTFSKFKIEDYGYIPKEMGIDDLSDEIYISRPNTSTYNISILGYNRIRNSFRINNYNDIHKMYYLDNVSYYRQCIKKALKDIQIEDEEIIEDLVCIFVNNSSVNVNTLKKLNYYIEILFKIKDSILNLLENHTDCFGDKTINGLSCYLNMDKPLVKCINCGKIFNPNNIDGKCSPRGNIYCTECFEKKYFSCNICGEIVEIGKMCSCGNTNRIYSKFLFLTMYDEGIYSCNKIKSNSSINLYDENYFIHKYDSFIDSMYILIIGNKALINKLVFIVDCISSNMKLRSLLSNFATEETTIMNMIRSNSIYKPYKDSEDFIKSHNFIIENKLNCGNKGLAILNNSYNEIIEIIFKLIDKNYEEIIKYY